MRLARRMVGGIALLLLAAVALVFGVVSFVQTETGRAWLVALIESQSAGAGTPVTIGRIEGIIPTDMTLHDVGIGDVEGRFLQIDSLRVSWDLMALLDRRLAVDAIEAGAVSIDRPPVAAPTSGTEPQPFTWPRLPVDIDLGRLSVDRLELGASIAGEPYAVSVEAAARLGDPSRGVLLDLDVSQLDGGAAKLKARVAFVPETNALSVDVVLGEPAGGLIATLAGIPGAPAIEVTVSGEGTLEDWAGDVSAKAGEAAMEGRARILAGRAETAIELRTTTSLATLLPLELADLVAGETRLDARIRIPDAAGPIAIERFDAVLAAGTLGLTGTVDPAGLNADVAIALDLPSPEPFATLIGSGIGWEGARLSLKLSGPFDRPRIEGEGLLTSPTGLGRSAETVAFAMTVEPDAPLSDPRTPIPITARVDARGLELGVGKLGAVVGRDVLVELIGTMTPSLSVEAAPISVTVDGGRATFAGRLDPASLAGRLDASFADLSRLAPLVGRPIEGRLGLAAGLDLDLAGGGVPVGRAEFELTTEGLVLAEPIVDGLLAGRLDGGGKLARTADGVLSIDDLSLTGDAVGLRASGSLGETDAALDLVFTLPELDRIDPRIHGSAEAKFKLAGAPMSPSLEGTISVPQAVVEGRRIEALSISFASADPLRQAELDFDFAGRIDDLPLAASGRFEAEAAGGGRLALRDLSAAGLSGSAELSIDGTGLVAGEAHAAIADLSTLSGIAGMPLAGSIEADVTLSRQDGIQGAVAKLALAAVEASGARIDRADLDISGTLDRLSIAGRIEAYEAAADFDASVRPSEEPILVDLTTLDLATRGRTARLSRPTGLSIGSDGLIEIGASEFALDGGSVTLVGSVAETLALTVDLRALPLALVDAIAPGSALGGTLSGRAEISGAPAAPIIAFDLSATGVTHPVQVSAGLQPIEGTAQGQVAGHRVELVATAASGRLASLEATGRVGFDGRLALAVKGNADISLANELLSAGADRVGGRADLDLSVGGTLAAPDIGGTVVVADASWSNEEIGAALRDISLRLDLQGRTIGVSTLRASTPNGGRLSGAGTIAIDPAAGFPADLSLGASDAEIVSSELVQATVDADLTIVGPLATGPRIGGTVDIRRMDIHVPDRLPPSVTLIDVEHRNLPPELRAQVPSPDPRRASAGGGTSPAPPGMVAALDLTVRAARGLFVRGMGIDAELGGDIRIAGTSAVPDVIGGFTMRRGSLSIIGQRLEFTRGVVTLDDGSLDPLLDLVAEVRAGTALARIVVEGRASLPRFRLESDPPLPPDEVLAQLLFAKSSSELSPIEALQVANAAAELAGVGVLEGVAGGFGVLDRLRQGLGIDRLDVTPDLSGGSGSSVTAGKYLGDGVYVGVERGVAGADTKAKVEVDVTDWLKLEAEVGTNSGEGVGVRMQWDY